MLPRPSHNDVLRAPTRPSVDSSSLNSVRCLPENAPADKRKIMTSATNGRETRRDGAGKNDGTPRAGTSTGWPDCRLTDGGQVSTRRGRETPPSSLRMQSGANDDDDNDDDGCCRTGRLPRDARSPLKSPGFGPAAAPPRSHRFLESRLQFWRRSERSCAHVRCEPSPAAEQLQTQSG